jgi:hypothetical protein
VHRDIEELQVKLKEILYDCVTEVRATKAALYLLDHPANQFELITEYGFKATARTRVADGDPIVDRCDRGPVPFFVNNMMEDPRYSAILYESMTERLLVAPIYLGKKLVGFVDMRDKAGRANFDANDSPKAQKVADRVAELFVEKNPFGQKFITISGNEPLQSILTGVYSSSAQQQPTPQPFPIPPAIAEVKSGIPLVRDILRTMLFIPGAVVAAYVSPDAQVIVAREEMTDEAFNLFESKLRGWLAKRGEIAAPLRKDVQTPLGPGGDPVQGTDIKKVFTAPVARGLYLSVAFSVEPERAAHELLAGFHKYLQLAVERS